MLQRNTSRVSCISVLKTLGRNKACMVLDYTEEQTVLSACVLHRQPACTTKLTFMISTFTPTILVLRTMICRTRVICLRFKDQGFFSRLIVEIKRPCPKHRWWMKQRKNWAIVFRRSSSESKWSTSPVCLQMHVHIQLKILFIELK